MIPSVTLQEVVSAVQVIIKVAKIFWLLFLAMTG